MEYEIYGQPAKKHNNGGGLVALTASVAESAYVGPNARVYGNAEVYRNARVYGNAEVSGKALVYGDARVYGGAMISDPQDIATLTLNGIDITITPQNAVIGCQCLEHKDWLKMTREYALRFGKGYADMFDAYSPWLKSLPMFRESISALDPGVSLAYVYQT